MWWAHHDVRFVVYRQALVYDNSADNNNVGTEVKGAQPDRLHWSQAKPLSQNQVSNDDVPVNLADGHYDEAAQRAAFQAAVAEWRGSAALGKQPALCRSTQLSPVDTALSLCCPTSRALAVPVRCAPQLRPR